MYKPNVSDGQGFFISLGQSVEKWFFTFEELNKKLMHFGTFAGSMCLSTNIYMFGWILEVKLTLSNEISLNSLQCIISLEFRI